MGLKLLNGCCCCFDLKSGVIIIGIFALIGHITSFSVLLSGNDSTCKRFYLKSCSDMSGGETAGITIWNVVNIILTIMMIYGSQKNIPSFILPTIIVSIIGMILLLGIIWATSISAFRGDESDLGVTMLIVGHAVWALTFYYFMVVYSRYKTLKQDQLPAYAKENSPLYP